MNGVIIKAKVSLLAAFPSIDSLGANWFAATAELNDVGTIMKGVGEGCSCAIDGSDRDADMEGGRSVGVGGAGGAEEACGGMAVSTLTVPPYYLFHTVHVVL